MVETVLLIVLVCVALAVIGLVLIQHGKGADAGASFGGGASQTVFGSSGSGNFLTKSTWLLAAVFFVACLGLAYIAREKAEGSGGFDFSAEPSVVEQQEPASGDVPQVDDDAEVQEEADTDLPVAEEPDAASLDSVAEDIEGAVSEESEAVDAAVEAAAEEAENAVNTAEEVLSAEQNQVEEVLDDASDTVEETVEAASEQVDSAAEAVEEALPE